MNDQLKTISCTDETAQSIIEKFCAHVHWLVTVRYIYTVLFEDEHPSCQTLMQQTASSFFDALEKILREYLYLECAKITDPATDGSNENFTVDWLVQKIDWPNNDILPELKSLQGKTEDLRSYIKPPRNKLIAHLDTRAVLSGKPLGAFPEGMDKTFFDALQKICNIAHEACFGRIYGGMSPRNCGDVINLRKTLEFAVAFKVALSDSSDETKRWLYSCLEKAGHGPKP